MAQFLRIVAWPENCIPFLSGDNSRVLSLFRRRAQSGPEVLTNLAANQPKKNIRVCCSRAGRTVLFCEECHGRGYEYNKIKHRDGCHTAHALATPELRPASASIEVGFSRISASDLS